MLRVCNYLGMRLHFCVIFYLENGYPKLIPHDVDSRSYSSLQSKILLPFVSYVCYAQVYDSGCEKNEKEGSEHICIFKYLRYL
jgi:hypothetical protein